MNNIEKVYGKVFNLGKLSLDTLVVNGTKNPDNDMRKDSMYYRTFDSSKYTNVATLDQLNINTTAYLVLGYKGHDENDKFVSEEVWMSPVGIETFKEFLNYAYEDIYKNSSSIYVKGRIAPEYEEYIVQTGYDDNGGGFGNVDSLGHILYIYPTICVTHDGNDVYNGVVIGFQDKDGNDYVQEMSLNTLYTLVNIINKYDYLNEMRLVTLIGMHYQSLTGNTNVVSSPSPSRPKSGLKSRAAIRKPLPIKKTLSEAIAEADEEVEIPEDMTEETTEPKKVKKTVKKSSAKPVTKKAEPKIGLADILNESEDIELDLDDEDEEF